MRFEVSTPPRMFGATSPRGATGGIGVLTGCCIGGIGRVGGAAALVDGRTSWALSASRRALAALSRSAFGPTGSACLNAASYASCAVAAGMVEAGVTPGTAGGMPDDLSGLDAPLALYGE